MITTVREDLKTELEEIDKAGLTKRERIIESPQGSHIEVNGGPRGPELLREQLPRPRRTTRASSRRRTQALDECGFGMASRPLHLRHPGHPQAARAEDRRIPRHRGHHPLRLLLRRQRRPVRDPARRGGRRHLRRAEPRLHHRRHPPVQGRAATATRTATWPTSRRSSRRRGRPSAPRLIATDGVFSHGRRRRQRWTGSATWPSSYDAMVMVDDCHATGFLGQDRPRHAGALRRAGPRGHHHLHPRQGARRRRRAASPPAAGRSSSCSASARRPYLFSNTLPPPIVGAALAVPRPALEARPSCATGSRRTRRASARG